MYTCTFKWKATACCGKISRLYYNGKDSILTTSGTTLVFIIVVVYITWRVAADDCRADDLLGSKEGADMLDRVIAHASLPLPPACEAPAGASDVIASSLPTTSRYTLERVHSNPPAG